MGEISVTGGPTLAPMCGRYAAGMTTDELVEMLVVDEDHSGRVSPGLMRSAQQPPPGEPDYNLAPTKLARVVLTRPRASEPTDTKQAGDVRQLRLLAWGLVPSWATDTSAAVRMINARCETVFAKPAFRAAAASRRCLIPATGWYEWQASPVATDGRGRPVKQPFFVYRDDGLPLVFAGLYEHWVIPGMDRQDPAAWLSTFTILTQAAEGGLDRIHARQPLVLNPDQWSTWLDPEMVKPSLLEPLLLPQPSGRFAAYPVGRAIGSSGANGPGVLRPLERGELHGVVDPDTGEIING